MKKFGFFFWFGIAFIALGIIFLIPGDVELRIGGFFLIPCGLFEIVVDFSNQKDKKTRNNIKKIENENSWDSSSGIILNKRDPDNEKRVLMKKYVSVGYGYVPPSATFTAATVGGVTTGGWDVREGHYEVGNVKKTDKYELFFTNRASTDFSKERSIICSIKTIQLNQEDIEAAQNNSILCQFLQKDKLVLKHEVKSAFSKDIGNYLRSGNIYAASNIAQTDLEAMQLTEEEAKEVLNFICGK